MNIQQINSAIMYGAWTNDELNSMVDAIKFNRAQLGGSVKRSLTLGSRVRWTSDRHPLGQDGTVVKIARKFVTVQTDRGQMWRVPANMLEVVARTAA